MRARPWSKDDLKLAFYLYCQLPFGKLHYRNPKIVELAGKIDRTPSSVAMKLVNFASLDPDVTRTGRRGLGNASAMDRQVWDEFHIDWEGLASESEAILGSRGETVPPSADETVGGELNYEGRTRAATVQARIGQGFFRSAVLASYDAKCCMTGLAIPELLVASHIVPWSADDGNRLNPRNGLCLSALHDRAFDAGLITVTEKFVIRVSHRVHKDESNWFSAKALCNLDGKKIRLPARFRPDPHFLERHATVSFKP